MTTQESIDKSLREKLAPVYCVVIDDSAMHAGHAGASEGGGHFTVVVASLAFDGKMLVDRHRVVYDALNEQMQSGAIHALVIKAFTPQEYNQIKNNTPPQASGSADDLIQLG